MDHDRESDILQDVQLDIRLPVVQRFDTWTLDKALVGAKKLFREPLKYMGKYEIFRELMKCLGNL